MKGWILFLAVGALALAASAADADVTVIEEIIAKVNGDVITQTELGRVREQSVDDLKRRQLADKEIKDALAEREQHFLRDRIDHLLLIQRGAQLDINVDQQVSKYLAEIMVQYKIADQDKFQQLIREQTGMPFEDFKEEVKNSMLTQRVLGQEVGSRIVIPREEVVSYYEEHKDEFIREERVFLSEILISTEEKDSDGVAAAEKKATELVERARRGEKFDELVRENSDAVTADSGGNLGGWKKGDLRKEIEDMVWTGERNYVTDPIRTENGFLILKVMAHHKAGLAHLEEVENEIMEKLYMPRFEPRVREYLTELRKEAFLEVKDDYADSGAAPGKDTSWTDPAKLTPETVTREEVASRTRKKRLLWLFPIPGTQSSPTSSSR